MSNNLKNSQKKKLVVLSGAGISAESGISTFRDSTGLWENYRIEDVASPEGFARDPEFVLNFYNARRRQLREVKPNAAHLILAELQQDLDVHIITQNVDDLHERAGSKNVIHLHGELKKVRPVDSENDIVKWENDLNVGDTDNRGIQLRPHIVWFGEVVSELEHAVKVVSEADYFLIIGTSMQVYPAAGLVEYVPSSGIVFVVDPQLENKFTNRENFFKTSATEGMRMLKQILRTKL
ncbi:SIR2 family NAD-dependent protein deacylase [Kaistella pullorum]|uniref:NAD-dependent protein deacylase n=1 Tax=Kaistella pullorum TaxID=2763074 RepID=A0ABR8WNF1_9FLAO|nr:NAD-dependent deacylase [Kaistella pullorum]MBD8018201.1 NAD-dependent deacylase [Kaistella pullorum]